MILEGLNVLYFPFRVVFGTNVFSAHITPPYESWDQFEPALESGIDVLLQTRIEEAGWTFPDAAIQEISEEQFPHHKYYRLRVGTAENPGFLAVQM